MLKIHGRWIHIPPLIRKYHLFLRVHRGLVFRESRMGQRFEKLWCKGFFGQAYGRSIFLCSVVSCGLSLQFCLTAMPLIDLPLDFYICAYEEMRGQTPFCCLYRWKRNLARNSGYFPASLALPAQPSFLSAAPSLPMYISIPFVDIRTLREWPLQCLVRSVQGPW